MVKSLIVKSSIRNSRSFLATGDMSPVAVSHFKVKLCNDDVNEKLPFDDVFGLCPLFLSKGMGTSQFL